jgi:hypothetical protein
MSRFFFNFTDGERVFPDPEGAELADLAAARAEAIMNARALLRRRFRPGQQLAGWRVCVVDETGRERLSIPLSQAAAMSVADEAPRAA